MNKISGCLVYSGQLKESAQLEVKWEALKGKTVLITGSTGMIGTYLIDLLMYRNLYCNNQISIVAISRNKDLAGEKFARYMDNPLFKYISQDVNLPILFEKKCDYIIQAAGNTHPMQYVLDPIGTITTNIIGTKNILDYALNSNTERVVFLSSVEVYGENRGDIKAFDEAYCGYIDCNTLRAGYPESKRVGEALCQAYIEKYKMDIVIPRLSRVYGPTMLQSDSKAVAQFIKKALEKEDIILKSEGNQLYSYTYVADAVSAILYIMLYGKSGEAYNIAGSESDITLKDLAELIAVQVNKKVKFEIPHAIEAKGYSTATRATLCTEKLSLLGWHSKYSIEKGITDTIDILSDKSITNEN